MRTVGKSPGRQRQSAMIWERMKMAPPCDTRNHRLSFAKRPCFSAKVVRQRSYIQPLNHFWSTTSTDEERNEAPRRSWMPTCTHMCRINKIYIFGGGDRTDEWMMTSNVKIVRMVVWRFTPATTPHTLPKENIQNMAMMNPITKYRAALSSASAKVM
jgi:hypothetical protein